MKDIRVPVWNSNLSHAQYEQKLMQIVDQWNAKKIVNTVQDFKRAVPSFVANVSLAQA